MTNLEFTGLVFLISAATGFLRSLTGLAGGVVIMPALTLLLGVDLRYAMGPAWYPLSRLQGLHRDE